MIIDMHVHYPRHNVAPDKIDEIVPELEQMLQLGRRLGIERQVLLSLDYGEESNKALRRLADRFDDQLVPFMRGSATDPHGAEAIERGVKEYGFKGVKLHHELPYFQLNGLLAAHPIFLKAAALDVPVLMHSWHQEEGLEHLSAELLGTGFFPVSIIEQIGKRYPETTLIFAHAGGMWVKAFQAGAPYPNVYFDVSGFDPERGIVEDAVRILGAERVLFGSDAPGRSYATQLAKVLYAEISDEDRALILGGNAARLLKMG